jgi:DNA-binding IclR family transcriptional regulator
LSSQLQRAIDILELVQEAPEPMALAEIARRLDLPKAAVYRLLQVWVARGYVEQELVAQRYVATLKLAIIGFGHLVATGLRDVCYPELRRLADETGELARLAVVDHDTLTWVLEAQGAREGLRYDGNLGRQAILHATAAGKAWLATLPEDEAIRRILAQGFRQPPETGPASIRTVEGMLAELRSCRARGYSTALDEAYLGVSSVAAPIFAGTGSGAQCVGSIIAVGPSTRMTPDRIARYVPVVQSTARRISELWPIRTHFVTDDPRNDTRPMERV